MIMLLKNLTFIEHSLLEWCVKLTKKKNRTILKKKLLCILNETFT